MDRDWDSYGLIFLMFLVYPVASRLPGKDKTFFFKDVTELAAADLGVSLAIYNKFQLFDLPAAGKVRDIFKADNLNISVGCVFDHFQGLINGFPLGRNIELWTVNNIPAFLSLGEFSCNLYFFHPAPHEKGFGA